MTDSPAETERERREIRVRGTVQGVGFRPFVYRLAVELGVGGWVRNDTQGVLIQAEAAPPVLDRFVRRLRDEAPSLSSVESVESTSLSVQGESRFRVRESPPAGSRRTIVPPDVAMCADCRREIEDPSDRRYRYPFLNCTNCGPRYSIIEGLPYDRPRTSMRRFPMCPACETEYHDPGNRRFHAQPTACPACGPTAVFETRDGEETARAYGAIEETARWLTEGRIVGLKGIGGFQLLVDATNEEAVARLRLRKRRGRKPFAVMMPDLAAITAIASVEPLARELLRSPASPIVLLPARTDGPVLAPSVAPGNPQIGAMLPYSPLHHLVMGRFGGPLVATSGNLSDEPICIDDREAHDRLGPLADGFLLHDRPIVRPLDDSVTRVIRGRVQILRRARGYAPMAVPAGAELPPVLAVGPQLKNTIAASVGDRIVVSQHLGDLDNAETFSAFRRAVADLRTFYEWSPRLVAHDAHPDYLSTRYAAGLGLPTVAVQHHYAHVLSCLVDAEVAPPVLGVAWDGTGYGTDGTIWGGEFLRVGEEGFERVGHLRPFPLVGGDAAAREPRRSAAGVLYALGGECTLADDGPALAPFGATERSAIRSLLLRSVQVVPTSSAGRLFDAVASLLGLVHRNDFEGEAAMALEFAAEEIPIGSPDAAPYPYRLTREGNGYLLDWGPAIEGILTERTHVARCAARFHTTLAEGITDLARRIAEPRVVLTGGCFQNRRLTELTIDGLSAVGCEVVWHARIPPNDGGIAVGQIAAAARVKTPGRLVQHYPARE